MQQAHTLKTLIANTICADTSLRDRDLHRRYETGTDIVAEERALLCATVGRSGPQSPKTSIVAEEMYVSSATMVYAIGPHPEVYRVTP